MQERLPKCNSLKSGRAGQETYSAREEKSAEVEVLLFAITRLIDAPHTSSQHRMRGEVGEVSLRFSRSPFCG